MLSPTQKRFLTVEQALMPATINFAINAWFVWFLFKAHAYLPLLPDGGPSVLADVLATLFLLPAITCLIVAPLVSSIVRKKPELRTKMKRSDYIGLGFLPINLFGRAAVIGVVAMVVFTPVVLLGIVLGGGYPISLDAYIWYKGAYAAVVSAVIGPIIAWSTICDQSARKA